MSSDLHFLTIAEAAKLIRAKKLSPVELTRAYLDRIDALEPQLNAFITRTSALARRQAKAAEAEIAKRRYRGPMHGIPFGLKDIYDTKGILTSGHSKTGIDNIPKADGTVTRKLYEAGGVLLGKLATHEYAHGGPSFDLPWPPARNPWNLEYFTGGSSSGSGAAVAAGFCPGAMGSDTGGSIRGPAGFCGIVGLMPTSGVVSRAGVIPNSYMLDHCGPMTWTVEDAAIMLQAIAGYDPADGGSVKLRVPNYRARIGKPIKGLRIGVLRHVWEEDLQVSDEAKAAMDAALAVLKKLGAKLVDVRMRHPRDYHDVKIVIAETEIFSIHHRDLASRPQDFGEDFLSRILPAVLFQSTDYLQAARQHRIMVHEAAKVFEKVDALVSVGFGPAPRLDAHGPVPFWAKPNANTLGNMIGGPVVALCNGFAANGMPLGMQFLGRPFDEATALGIAHAYEQATGWRERRPQLTPGAAQPTIAFKRWDPPEPELDAGKRDLVRAMAKKAGLNLGERQMAILMAMAPYALAMADRVRKAPERSIDPSSVFRYPGM